VNGPELLVNLWRAVEAAGGKPTINSVLAAASGFGLKIRRADAYRILTPFRNSSDTRREHESVPTGTPPEQPGNVPRARAAKVLVPKLGLFADANSELVATPKPKKPPAEWTIPLLADVTALNDRELRSLSSRELFTLARAHALLFGNCTVSEPTNKSRASPIATGLTYLIDQLSRKSLADFRVDEYLAAGRNVTQRRGGTPWFKPSLILPEITTGANENGTTITEPRDATPALRRPDGERS
jgi:hypothetical protein